MPSSLRSPLPDLLTTYTFERSDTFIPDDLDGQGDDRALGLKIRSMLLGGRGARNDVIPLDAPMLASGFHAIEGQGDRVWRWTNGDAVLPSALWPGVAGTVALQLGIELDAIRAWQAPVMVAERPAERRPTRRMGSPA